MSISRGQAEWTTAHLHDKKKKEAGRHLCSGKGRCLPICLPYGSQGRRMLNFLENAKMFSEIGCTILHSCVQCTRDPDATSLSAFGTVHLANFSYSTSSVG